MIHRIGVARTAPKLAFEAFQDPQIDVQGTARRCDDLEEGDRPSEEPPKDLLIDIRVKYRVTEYSGECDKVAPLPK